MNLQTVKFELIDELVTLVSNANVYEKTDGTDQVILHVLSLPADTYDQILASISEIKEENQKIVPYASVRALSHCYLDLSEDEDYVREHHLQFRLKDRLLRGLHEIAMNLYSPEPDPIDDPEMIAFIHKGISLYGSEAAPSNLYSAVEEMNTYIDRSRNHKFIRMS